MDDDVRPRPWSEENLKELHKRYYAAMRAGLTINEAREVMGYSGQAPNRPGPDPRADEIVGAPLPSPARFYNTDRKGPSELEVRLAKLVITLLVWASALWAMASSYTFLMYFDPITGLTQTGLSAPAVVLLAIPGMPITGLAVIVAAFYITRGVLLTVSWAKWAIETPPVKRSE